jgi:hypothetical protein
MLANKKHITFLYFLTNALKYAASTGKQAVCWNGLRHLRCYYRFRQRVISRGGASRRGELSSELISTHLFVPAYLRFVGFEDLTAVTVKRL